MDSTFLLRMESLAVLIGPRCHSLELGCILDGETLDSLQDLAILQEL